MNMLGKFVKQKTYDPLKCWETQNGDVLKPSHGIPVTFPKNHQIQAIFHQQVRTVPKVEETSERTLFSAFFGG